MIQNPDTQIDLAILSVEEGYDRAFPRVRSSSSTDPFTRPTENGSSYGNNESGNLGSLCPPGRRQPRQVAGLVGRRERILTWSGDGKEIFLAYENGRVQTVDVEANGGQFRVSRPRDLFSGSFADLTASSCMYDVAPDGERFVLFQGELDQTSSGHEHGPRDLRLVRGARADVRQVATGSRVRAGPYRGSPL